LRVKDNGAWLVWILFKDLLFCMKGYYRNEACSLFYAGYHNVDKQWIISECLNRYSFFWV